MTRASTSRRHQLLALLLGVGLALGLGELVLRIARPAQLDRIRYPCFYVPDDTTGFRYAPNAEGRVAGHFEIDNTVVTNSLGFYDDEPLAGRAAPRVLAVGDSFTAAMNVPRDAVWTAVLERLLRERGHPEADVVNLGLDGTGTDAHVALLREYVPRLRPDVVVVAFFANDVGDVQSGRFTRECYRDTVLSYQTGGQRDRLRARVDAWRASPVRRFLYDHLLLARLVAAPFLPPLNPWHIQFLQPRRAEIEAEAGEDAQAAGRERLAAAVAGLAEIARTCDCRLVVAPVPPRSEAAGSRRTWLRLAGEAPIPWIDVLPSIEALREEQGLSHADLYFEHDAHLNAQGNALYGRAVADALLGAAER